MFTKILLQNKKKSKYIKILNIKKKNLTSKIKKKY